MPEELESKRGVCHYHLCRKRTTIYRCRFCGKYFCEEHLNPKLPLLAPFERRGRRAVFDTDKWREKGHPCPPYADYLKTKEKEDLEKRWKALDKMRELPPVRELPPSPPTLPPTPSRETPGYEIRYEAPYKPKRKIRRYLIAFLVVVALILFRVLWFFFTGK
jgi:hypothetical protein